MEPDNMSNISNSDFDSTIRSQILLLATNEHIRFATPISVCSKNQEINLNRRKRRTIKEIVLTARINDPNSDIYDLDAKIYIFGADFDFWSLIERTRRNSI